MHSANLLGGEHRADKGPWGEHLGESRGDKSRKGIGGNQREDFTDVYSVHTDWDKTGMPGPKGRTTVVVV